ncbi:major facilitator superfamily transporter [Stemphylium lycopersici]|nr:major facilitator superfamily transporter [Stemphylium lycopersici]RAR10366.1 major facilitator superfamily transporter [Stemphylium lycopersici]
MEDEEIQHRIEKVEINVMGLKNDKEEGVKLDYSGSHAKTSPDEIALVKKLDLWITPTLWLMFWLNYSD